MYILCFIKQAWTKLKFTEQIHMSSSSLSRSESVIVDKNVLCFLDIFLFFGELCGPAASLRTFLLSSFQKLCQG